MKKKLTIVYIVIFADTIMEYFSDVKKGIASGFAYYELLIEGEKYLKKPNKEFEEYLDLTFNIQKKDLTKIKKDYQKQLKELKKLGILE